MNPVAHNPRSHCQLSRQSPVSNLNLDSQSGHSTTQRWLVLAVDWWTGYCIHRTGCSLAICVSAKMQGLYRYGGAYQYVQWAGGSGILDFFSNPTIIGWYQNNMKTIVGRRNSITGVVYKDDPAIFGWELINEPHVPGDDSGSMLTVCLNPYWDAWQSLPEYYKRESGILQRQASISLTLGKLASSNQNRSLPLVHYATALSSPDGYLGLQAFRFGVQKWISTQSQYLKSLDSNHLVGVGVEGFYGQSTPSRLPDNPSPSLSANDNGGSSAPYAAICEGQDFTANHSPQACIVLKPSVCPHWWCGCHSLIPCMTSS